MSVEENHLPLTGLLNLHKPAGISSRQAVDHVKRLVRPAKAGHAGTLDPLATGVLVVCIGKATRLVDFIQQMPKRYRATFLLGRTSPTEDIEGELTELAESRTPGADEIVAACGRFTGTISQRPPAFSALKVAGKRAYQLARRGEDVQLAPRPVSIHQLTVIEYAYPRLTLDIRCSAGTYVRSLGRDIAESLGTGAVMSELTRTEVGAFSIDQAIHLDRLTSATLASELLPPQQALIGFPQMVLTGREIAGLAYGRGIDRTGAEFPDSTDAPLQLAGLGEDGSLVAVLERRSDGTFWPFVNFVGRS